MKMKAKMSEMKIGQRGIIRENTARGDMRRRLCDIGFTRGAQVCCIERSPLLDPTAYLIKGALIALRSEDAGLLYVDIE